jgi:hypothetical protein
MKTFKKALVTLATVSALAGAGSANAFLQNWFLDPDAAAAGSAGFTVGEYLDLTGTAYVHNTFSSLTNFTFQEAGTFRSNTADGGSGSFGTDFFGTPLSATFTGTGSGTVALAGGTLGFSTGTLKLFDVSNNAVGTFDLQVGNAALQPNSVLPNGIISIMFKATSLTAGYFFKDATKTVDLATVVGDPEGLLFGFATTNASLITTPSVISTVAANVAPLYFGEFGSLPTINPATYGRDDLVISNNGQYRLEVPEPGSLALAGLAIFGLGAIRRRRTAK